MFPVGVLAVGRVLWWIRTLHIQIRTPRDNFLHAGFLSPPVSDRATEGFSVRITALVTSRNTNRAGARLGPTVELEGHLSLVDWRLLTRLLHSPVAV
eukprot:scaffold20372_cov104-Phaeocystis_antarctica.AAC.1